MTKKYILGLFRDEEPLLHAVHELRKEGNKIHEVYTPFPVHGLDEALGYKRSRLPRAAFLFGCLGGTLGLSMQAWMLGVDWPMNIGGKPALAWLRRTPSMPTVRICVPLLPVPLPATERVMITLFWN